MSARNPGSRNRQANLAFALPRQVATGIKLRYRNILARPEQIWILDDAFECVVDAAGPPNELPTAHDRNHAAVVSFLASQQPQFLNLRCPTALLLYRNNTRRRISIDLNLAKEMCDRASQSARRLRQPIPAPLVGLLYSTGSSANFVCRKQHDT